MSTIALTREQDMRNKITSARGRLVTDHPFFAVLSLKPKLIRLEAAQCSTMATDGNAIYYCDEFVESQSIKELTAVFAHEALHIAFSHHLRRGKRIPDLWNQACDYVIDPILLEAGFTLPTGEGLEQHQDRRFAGMTAERVYEILLKETPPQQLAAMMAAAGQGDGKQDQSKPKPGGRAGEVWDMVNEKTGEALSPAERAAAEREVKLTVLQAEQAEKACGSGSCDAVRQITDSMREVKVDWWDQLADKLLSRTIHDICFSRPVRRLLSHGYILPGVFSEPSGSIVIAVDTSASLGAEELGFIAKHMRAILAAANPEKVWVIYCDSRVNHVDEFDQGDELVLEMHGGGGTAFHPPFNYVTDQGIEPDALIYFTDGEGSVGQLKGGEPNYPVIWATTHRAPSFYSGERFGDVIDIEFK